MYATHVKSGSNLWWRQAKYDRLLDAHRKLQKTNNALEDKLLRIVDKFESDKNQGQSIQIVSDRGSLQKEGMLWVSATSVQTIVLSVRYRQPIFGRYDICHLSLISAYVKISDYLPIRGHIGR